MKSKYIKHTTIYKIKGNIKSGLRLAMVDEYNNLYIQLIAPQNDIGDDICRFDEKRFCNRYKVLMSYKVDDKTITCYSLNEEQYNYFLGIIKDFVKSFNLEPKYDYSFVNRTTEPVAVKEDDFVDTLTDKEIIENTENAVESRIRKSLKD